MNSITGNAFDLAIDGEFDVLIHGCNCRKTMGAGFAKEAKRRFPQIFDADKRYHAECGGKVKDMLGTCSWAVCLGEADHKFLVYNGYTQATHGRLKNQKDGGKNRGLQVDYSAIRSVFAFIAQDVPKSSKIGYPMIGAGLGGGDWGDISKIINEELEGHDHTLIVLPDMNINHGLSSL